MGVFGYAAPNHCLILPEQASSSPASEGNRVHSSKRQEGKGDTNESIKNSLGKRRAVQKRVGFDIEPLTTKKKWSADAKKSKAAAVSAKEISPDDAPTKKPCPHCATIQSNNSTHTQHKFDVWQGRFDELALLAETAGVDSSKIAEIRNYC